MAVCLHYVLQWFWPPSGLYVWYAATILHHAQSSIGLNISGFGKQSGFTMGQFATPGIASVIHLAIITAWRKVSHERRS